MNDYLKDIYQKLETKYYYQKEYLQAVFNFLKSVDTVFDSYPDIKHLSIIERLVEPDRLISFKVAWLDDLGNVRVNKGYRVQFNNLVGPYKGGIRFNPSVNESILKFLGFEQTFKNALTGLSLGGAKGGSDFDPKGKSDFEIMRFCQSFMTELYQYIGPDIDVPAGDLGVGAKEIGYMFGMYKKITHRHNGTFTGKGLSFGGSEVRPEATGYGLCYITERALKTFLNTDLKGKTVIISGSGNVAIHTAFKAVELGAKVVAMSSTTGGIFNKDGLDISLVKKIKDEHLSLETYLDSDASTNFFKDPKEIWSYPCDIALPCAKENELDLEDAKKLHKNNVLLVAEGANMPSTSEASEYFIHNKIIYIPGKAANAGGVSVSGLEMSQNASYANWSFRKVDSKLKSIMENIFDDIYSVAELLDNPYDLEKGAHLAAFIKLYDAMKAQGI